MKRTKKSSKKKKIINLISRVEHGNEVLKSGTFGGALFASNGKFLLRRVDAAPTDGGETLQKWEAMILALPGSLLLCCCRHLKAQLLELIMLSCVSFLFLSCYWLLVPKIVLLLTKSAPSPSFHSLAEAEQAVTAQEDQGAAPLSGQVSSQEIQARRGRQNTENITRQHPSHHRPP